MHLLAPHSYLYAVIDIFRVANTGCPHKDVMTHEDTIECICFTGQNIVQLTYVQIIHI